MAGVRGSRKGDLTGLKNSNIAFSFTAVEVEGETSTELFGISVLSEELMNAQMRSTGIGLSFFNFGARWGGGGGQRHAPAALPQEDKPGTHCIGGWTRPRAGLDGRGKSRPPAGFDPRTVQPVARGYSDCAVSAHSDASTSHLEIELSRYQPVTNQILFGQP